MKKYNITVFTCCYVLVWSFISHYKEGTRDWEHGADKICGPKRKEIPGEWRKLTVVVPSFAFSIQSQYITDHTTVNRLLTGWIGFVCHDRTSSGWSSTLGFHKWQETVQQIVCISVWGEGCTLCRFSIHQHLDCSEKTDQLWVTTTEIGNISCITLPLHPQLSSTQIVEFALFYINCLDRIHCFCPYTYSVNIGSLSSLTVR